MRIEDLVKLEPMIPRIQKAVETSKRYMDDPEVPKALDLVRKIENDPDIKEALQTADDVMKVLSGGS